MSKKVKRLLLLVILAVVTFGLATCKKEETIVPPTVKVFDGAITIEYSKASVAAEVTDQGGSEVKSRGFVYGLSGGSLDTIFCGSGVGVYSAELNNLQPNTTYVYEAFAKNAGGTGTSGKVSFTTKPLPTFTISVSANPSDGGVVNGGGSFQEGQYCTVMATANDGYTFTNWTENGNEVSTDANYTFMVNGERTLKANFTAQLPNEYTISLSANPNNGGSVSGGGTYQEGEFCTVSATANDDYAFTNWTEGNEEVSSDANYTFTVNGNRTLVAHFELLPPNSYSINVSADPSNGGSVSGGGTFEEGQSCTVRATANNGYIFSNWTENGNEISTNASYTFTVNSNRTLVAHFSAIGTSNYTVNVSASPSNGGTVTGGGTYEQGQSCTVRATANSGYTFTNWTENGNEVSTNANYSFTVNSNRNLVAHFTAQGTNTYSINISANPSNGGTVTGGGTYEQGQSCTVRATANNGYTFVNWTENGTQVSANANYTFTVNGNRNLVANFTQQNTYTINAGVTPTGAGTVTGDGTYQQGQSCTLRATPATGFTFQKWTKNGTQVSTNATYTFTVTESATFVAHFQLMTYTISASASPSSGGSVTGGGNYNYGENCTLRATTASGYTFVNWTKNGTQVSTNPTYTFSVTASASYVAHFDQQSYNINLSASPSNGGTVSGGGIHYYGQSCTVHAVANNGYTFTNWTENGSQVSTNANYTFTVTGNRTLVAHFTANPQNYIISVSANPSNGGSVSGGGTYQQGQSCTVHAVANSGYTFTNWTENGSQVSTNANYTFTVTGNRNLVAHFIYNPQAPTGAINGLFSVSATQQVWFSQGNLQYRASTNKWRFAINQWEYVGGTDQGVEYGNVYEGGVKCSNNLISSSYSGWIDVYGWGTSSWHDNNDPYNVYYYPYSASTWGDIVNTTYNQNGYGPSTNMPSPNLTGSSANYDWGVYNPIINGGNTSNTWRTLTADEWDYVLNTRSTASGIRYAKAQITGVDGEPINGVVLLPDSWSLNYYTLNNTNQSYSEYSNNVLNYSIWINSLESHGAVFLPITGRRQNPGQWDSDGDGGCYWSTSYIDSYYAYHFYFTNISIGATGHGPRYYGFSVRLVCPAN